MFKIIIQVIILIYLIAIFYHSSQLQKFNMNGFIIETYNQQVMYDNMNILNPVLLKSDINYHSNEILPPTF